jgi:hypothetical protein
LEARPKTSGYNFSPVIPLFGGQKIDIVDRDTHIEGCRQEQMSEIESIQNFINFESKKNLQKMETQGNGDDIEETQKQAKKEKKSLLT